MLRDVKVILLGFVLHVVFLLSVFDIYFKSPITQNISNQYSYLLPPAKRIVLFVADGLRADSFYSMRNNKYPSSYLRYVAMSAMLSDMPSYVKSSFKS